MGQVELFITLNPEFAGLLVKGRSGQDLTEAERLRLWVFYGNVLRTWQNMHHQYLADALDKTLWDGNRNRLEKILQEDEGLVTTWREDHAQYSPEYNALVKKMIEAQRSAH